MDGEFTTDDISVRFTMSIKDFFDLLQERDQLRVVVGDAVAWCERNDNEPYWLSDARAALKGDE